MEEVMFRKYPKIYSLDKQECDGILNGTVLIEEKIDGAQASIWLEEDGIHCGSRNHDVTNDSFRGFTQYVKESKAINRYLLGHKNHTLYGEWLVPHTLGYDLESYNKFYLYEIFCRKTGKIFNSSELDEEGIFKVPFFVMLDDPNLEDIKNFVGQSKLGKTGEGVVLKNYEFINKFGNHCHAKIVVDRFKEITRIKSVAIPGSIEGECCRLYANPARVQKILHKISDENMHPIAYKARVIDTLYHDILTEEITAISKKASAPFDFRLFQRSVKDHGSKIFSALTKKEEETCA